MEIKRISWIVSTAALLGVAVFVLPSFFISEVDFNEDIRPILNDKCLKCHGGVKQLGGLSFLFEADAKEEVESGGRAIVDGKSTQSLLIDRIKHKDPELRMPPEGPPLSTGEIKLFERWIEQGAKWKSHWAYVELPAIETLPPVNIDHYIEKAIDEQGLELSPPARKETLLRRTSLDLIGLPPSPVDIQVFLEDESLKSFENQVDRMLSSPHFGERWAALWMDLARYGDSQGYQKDPYRSIWRYRDWLIEAFNRNLPFDQFTIEQLAGDLLPDPDESQLLATAFHRNTMTNDEGGTDDEEFRVAAVLDRVSTTWEVWQGTSMACVQCHSHPYDPFRHQDFYQLYAFFNNTKDADTYTEKPLLYSYSKADRQLIEDLGIQNRMLETEIPLPSLELEKVRNRLLELPGIRQDRREALERAGLIKTPIMQERSDDSSRTSYLFERGNWLVHGDQMYPGVPSSMPSLESSGAPNRLDLANWLVSKSNPLTARVSVNRFWEALFGSGIVTTLEDFGTMGNQPSHPQLLDWLAVKFRDELNWNIKALLKLMVLSDVYQRSSITSDEQMTADPENIFLARMPRRRLNAEQIRDQALAVSNLLSHKMYGPSVMPPQPEGVWQVIRNVMKWKESEGEDRYRRALYTFWRKSSPYPSLITFDNPSREFCVSRRITTNTPLQALVTLNDTVYVEAASALAQGAMNATQGKMDKVIEEMYFRALGKRPLPETLKILEEQYWNSHQSYEKLAVNSKMREEQIDQSAMGTVASVIMNLDEFLVIE